MKTKDAWDSYYHRDNKTIHLYGIYPHMPYEIDCEHETADYWIEHIRRSKKDWCEEMEVVIRSLWPSPDSEKVELGLATTAELLEEIAVRAKTVGMLDISRLANARR